MPLIRTAAPAFFLGWKSGVAVTVTFALVARLLRGVTNFGAITGAVLCFLLYIGGGLGAFAMVVVVFALAWVSTRVGYRRKMQLGTAEKREGRRASQVLANLSVGAVCALIYGLSRQSAWLLASVAALAEAAADTVSSEIGQTSSSTARLITNWEAVEAGTDGAITVLGSVAGITAGSFVGATAVLAGLIPGAWIVFPVLAATVGMLADSLLGASLERQRVLNNDGVNFLGTLIAAAVAGGCYVLFS